MRAVWAYVSSIRREPVRIPEICYWRRYVLQPLALARALLRLLSWAIERVEPQHVFRSPGHGRLDV